MKNTKDIESLKDAIKEQHCDVQFYIDAANSIAHELHNINASRSYIYSKIKVLKELERF